MIPMRLSLLLSAFLFLCPLHEGKTQVISKAPEEAASPVPKTEFYLSLRGGVFLPKFKDSFLELDRVEFITDATLYPAIQLGLAHLVAPSIGLHFTLEAQVAYLPTKQNVNFYAIQGTDFWGRWASITEYHTYTNRQ